MSRCDNCIYFEEKDNEMICHKENKFVGIRRAFSICDDFEHWNNISSDGV